MSGTSTFIKEHPLNFVLYYENYVNLNTIYLDDGYPALPLYWEIFNLSDKSIKLSAPTANNDRNTKEQCHFYLRIPQGVLKIADPESIISDDKWKMVYVPAASSSSQSTHNPGAYPGYDTLYCSCNTEKIITAKNPDDRDDPSNKIILTLNQIHAAPGVQSRSSSIKFKYGGLTAYQDNKPVIDLADRGYDYSLYVINHLGKKKIPLHAGFAGSNTILNDGGTPNELQLQITSIQDKNNPRPNLAIGKDSQFIISFEEGDLDQEWALAESDQIEEINIAVNTPTSLTDEVKQRIAEEVTQSIADSKTFDYSGVSISIFDKNKILELKEALPTQGFTVYRSGKMISWKDRPWSLWQLNQLLALIETKNSQQPLDPKERQEIKELSNAWQIQKDVDKRQWTVKPILKADGTPKKASLAPGESINLDISNIKSAHPSGQTKLTIRYQEIPDYWDGDLVCIIEKTPLMYRGPLKATANDQILTAVRIKTNFDDDAKSDVKHVGLAVETGNVGIGTTNPTEKLHVEGNIQTNNAFIGSTHNGLAGFSHKDQGNTAGGYGLLQNSSGRTILNAASSQDIAFKINNTEKMTLASDGNLGIGTTSPSAKLEVTGNIKTTDAFIGSVWDEAVFSHKNNASQTGYALLQQSNNDTILNAVAGKDIRFNLGNVTRGMTLKSDGKLGIGTTSPSEKLEVNGNIKTNNAFIGSAHSGWAGFSHKDQGNTSGGFGLLHDSSGETILNAASGQLIRFHINNSEKMRLSSNGNLGIGTTSPQAKLHVNGSTIATKIKIGSTEINQSDLAKLKQLANNR